MPPVIEARGLTKRYGQLTAVDGVSIAIQVGECFGFLGPNGAGKTSTVRMIHCSSPVTAGDLKVFGMDVRREPRAIKARIGVCQQEDNLDPDFSVRKNLTVFARYFGIPAAAAEERARELLEFIGLWERRDARIREMGLGRMPADLWWDLVYLVAATVPLWVLGIYLMKRRLVK